MTCIVGIIEKDNSRVIIGGDSAAGNGYEINIRKDAKVFSVGDFIFGCTSSFRMIQLIRYSFEPPAMAAHSVGLKGPESLDLFKYMCTSFIDALRSCLRGGGFLETKNEVEHGGEFLVGYKNRLFCIHSDFQVSESADRFASVGSGSSYALGALKAITENTSLDSKEIAERALTIASYFSGGVRPPFNFVSTNPTG